jgi:hypothetical protein
VVAQQLAAHLLLGGDRVQVGSRVLLAHHATAVRIDRAVVVGELGVLELDAALRYERRACVSCVRRCVRAVERVRVSCASVSVWA